MTVPFATPEPARADVDRLAGATLLEFGTGWCGWCARAQPLIAEALQSQPGLRHLRIEDGPGQPLGRSYGVKLWPTLVVLKQGQEVARLIRPDSAQAIRDALAQAAVPA